MSSYLRVALLSFHSSPIAILGSGNAGGMNVYVNNLSQALGGMGVFVDIFTRCSDINLAGAIFLFPNVRLVNLYDPNIDKEKFHIEKGLLTFKDEIQKFVLAESIEYDIVHSHYWLSALVAQELSDQWNIAHVTTFHTIADIKNICLMWQIENSRRIFAEREIAIKADVVLAADTHEIEFLSRAYRIPNHKFKLTSGGVDPLKFYPIDKLLARKKLNIGDEKILLFVGRLDPIKGLNLLLEAAYLVKEFYSVKIIVIGGDSGENSEIQKLDKLAQDLGITEKVIFINAVDQNTLSYFYSAADILTIPSYYESFGLVALEAMSCGLPVIAMSTGGLTNLIVHGETGLLVGKRSPQIFASAILSLLNNESMRINMGKNGIRRASSFSWSRVAESVIETYEKLTTSYLSA